MCSNKGGLGGLGEYLPSLLLANKDDALRWMIANKDYVLRWMIANKDDVLRWMMHM